MRAWTLSEALAYGHGVERPFLCPVHGDRRPSASVNVIKRMWICYSCGAHGGLTGEYALVEPDYEEMQHWFLDRMEEVRTYPESWLSLWDSGPTHPYWTARVGDDAARHFRLGFDAEADAVTYPLRATDGVVLGVVRRPLSPGDGPKYLYPKRLDIGRLLFNYSYEHRPVVYLTEGALDAVALWRVGLHAMAIYGSRLSEEQVTLIDQIDPEVVVTCYDNDDAGFHAHCETERAFKHRLVERMTWPRTWGKDVDELGEARLRKVVDRLASTRVSCVGSDTWISTSRIEKPKPLRIRPALTA